MSAELVVTVVGVLLTALLLALGFLIRTWIGGLSGDIQAVGTTMHDVVDKMSSIDRRVAVLEGWKSAMGTVVGGRRRTDPPGQD